MIKIVHGPNYDTLIIGSGRPKTNKWLMLVVGFESNKRCQWAKFSVN